MQFVYWLKEHLRCFWHPKAQFSSAGMSKHSARARVLSPAHTHAQASTHAISLPLSPYAQVHQLHLNKSTRPK